MNDGIQTKEIFAFNFDRLSTYAAEFIMSVRPDKGRKPLSFIKTRAYTSKVRGKPHRMVINYKV